MKHVLTESREQFTSAIRDRNILLCLDFDGTLSPIAPTPEDAILPEQIRALLKKILKLPGIIVAVVSGRALGDLKAKISVDGIVYIGNHGWESDDGYLCEITEEARQAMDMARARWAEISGQYDGTYFQDKNVTLSLHFRNVEGSKQEVLRKAVMADYASWPKKRLLHMGEGKKVFELRPAVECHKGTAVKHLRAQYPDHLPVYLGDDVTDEDAFRVLQAHGWPVRVGMWDKSCATYYIINQEETIPFLQLIEGERQ